MREDKYTSLNRCEGSNNEEYYEEESQKLADAVAKELARQLK